VTPHRLVNPDALARPVGFAHAVVAAPGPVVALAGQVAHDADGVCRGTTLPEQFARALDDVVAALAAAGANVQRLVRLTWFITDRDAYLRERKAIGAAYREIIGRYFPPMSVIVVAGLLEPGAEVEIEATAVIPPISS